jgi:hypothetical protein
MNLIRPNRVDIRPVADEDNPGRIGGYQVHHWSGRVDAIIRPAPIRARVPMRLAFRPTPTETTESGLVVPASVRADG